MEKLFSLLLGYIVGMISPSALFGKLKHVNLKEEGTKNLGASNAVLLLGKGYGALIMVIDICKSLFVGKFARWLFPNLALAGFIACFGAVLGHIWPAYLNFNGGKGLACFGGMVLFYDLKLFWFYLIFGVALMVLMNRSVVLPLFVSVTFPLIVWFTSHDPGILAMSILTGVVILFVHRNNFGRVSRGEEAPMRNIIRYIFKRK